MGTAIHSIESGTPRPLQLADAQNTKELLDTMPWLPCILTLDIPLVHFTIRDLLKLTKGSIVETACHNTSDVPLRVNGLLIGWTEFEVIGDHLAVRITDQA